MLPVLVLVPLASLLALGWVGRPPREFGVGPRLGDILGAVLQPQRLTLTVMAALTLAAGQGAFYVLPYAAEQRDLGPFTSALLLGPYVAGSVIAGPFGGRVVTALPRAR